MAEQSPTPWAADPDDREGMSWNIQIVQEGNPNMRVCFMTSGPEAAPNAAFIVKAVNNHDALVAALTKARARIEYLGAACSNEKHFVSNERDFLPEIDAALQEAGK